MRVHTGASTTDDRQTDVSGPGESLHLKKKIVEHVYTMPLSVNNENKLGGSFTLGIDLGPVFWFRIRWSF